MIPGLALLLLIVSFFTRRCGERSSGPSSLFILVVVQGQLGELGHDLPLAGAVCTGSMHLALFGAAIYAGRRPFLPTPCAAFSAAVGSLSRLFRRGVRRRPFRRRGPADSDRRSSGLRQRIALPVLARSRWLGRWAGCGRRAGARGVHGDRDGLPRLRRGACSRRDGHGAGAAGVPAAADRRRATGPPTSTSHWSPVKRCSAWARARGRRLYPEWHITWSDDHVREGQLVEVHLRNASVPTCTLHWHGVDVPSRWTVWPA